VTIAGRSNHGQTGRMRNTIARVTLSAFFCVASATAQGRATFSGTASLGTGTAIQLGAGSSLAAEQRREQHQAGLLAFDGITGGSSRSYAPSSYDSSNIFTNGPRLDAPVIPQDQAPYSLTRLFRQHHGEFLDRHERFDPQLELSLRFLPNQRVGDEPGDFDLLRYDFDIEAPLVITTEAYLLFGLYHYGRSYSTSSAFGSANNSPSVNSEGSLGNETLTAAGVRLGLGWFLNDNLLMEVQTNPGVYSDLENTLGHKDYDFPSSALFSYRAIDNFFFKFGLRYNQIYEDAPWLPYLGFSWEITEGLRLDAGNTGVRFTTIDPGMVETDFSEVRFRGDREQADAVYADWSPLQPADVADAILYAVTRPAHVNIGEIVLWSSQQTSTRDVHKP